MQAFCNSMEKTVQMTAITGKTTNVVLGKHILVSQMERESEPAGQWILPSLQL